MSGAEAVVHAPPQSCWKTPRPRIPLAPSAATALSSAAPAPLMQLEGTGNAGEALIIWMGTDAAFSPAIWMSADTTGPQTYERSAKLTHSWSALPLVSATAGSERLTCEDRMRSPSEPVSNCTFSMVWQFDEPGAQMVTATKASFVELFAGPRFT